MNYIDQLISHCNKAKAASPVREVVIRSLDELERVQDIKKAVYIIEQVDGSAEKVFCNFKQFKETKQFACAKLNVPSDVLYVGSSTTGVRSRLTQHLKQANKGTYALHMACWFEGEYKVTVREYDQDIEVIQIIEDAISHRLKPAFGKKGSNNK